MEGEVSLRQWRELEPELERLFNEFDKVNVVVVMKPFSGYGIREMLADTRFVIRHWRHIGRVAVVGDRKWEEIAARLDNLFGNWEERFFHMDELEQAWAWVEGKQAQSPGPRPGYCPVEEPGRRAPDLRGIRKWPRAAR